MLWLACFGAGLAATQDGARAQTNNFTNAASANWSAASAWSLGVPTSAQDAYHTNVTTGTVAINVTTAAQANSLTLGGSGGTATVTTFANQSLTVGGNITLASGAGTAELRLSGTNSTVTLNGGAGSIINGGGAGLATLNVQGGFSNSVGLLTASVDDLNMGQSGSGTLIITNGQTYNVSSLLRLNNSTASNNATILMNGGTLNYSGPNEIRLNSGAGAGNTAYLVLNSNALVTATTIQRQNLGADAAIQWNDGTIGNYAGTNLVIQANGTTNGIMNLKLAGTGTHTFDAGSTNTITVASTAQLQDKTGEAGTLAKAGTGVLILSGSNSYTGGTTLNAGTIRVNNDNGLGSGGLTLNAGTLSSTNARTLANNVTVGGAVALGESATGTGALTFNGTVDLGSGNTVTVNRTSTFANAVSGTGTFNVSTNGSVVVSGSGSMTTGTAINLTTNATSFDISGVSGAGVTVGSVASVASSTVALGGKALTLGGDNTSTTLAGTVTGATGGSLIKEGSGTLTLSVANSHTGGVTLNAGAIAVGNNGALGTGTFTINGGALASDSATARSLTNAVTMGGNLQLGNATGTGDLTLSGGLDLGAGTRTFTVNNSATLSGALSNGALTKAGAGTLQLSVSNGFAGGVTLSAGTLRVNNNSALGTGTFTINGGTFATASSVGRTVSNAVTMGGNVQFGDDIGTGALTLSGGVDLGAATRTITVSNNSTTLSGAITNGALTKAGNGTLTLSGTSSYAGGAVINGGVLRVTSTGGLGAASGAVTINDGATLSIGTSFSTASTAHDLVIGGNATWVVTGSRTWGVAANSNTVTGSGTLNLDVASGQALSLVSALNLDSGSTMAFGSGAGTYTASGTQNTGNAGVNFDLGSDALTFRISTSAGTGTKTHHFGSLSGGATTMLEGSVSSGTGTDTAVIGALNSNSTFAGTIRDGQGATNRILALQKTGTGTLTLSGANTYSGATTVAGGTLRIDGNSRLGNTTTTVTISNAAVLEVTAGAVLTNAITIGAGNGVLLNSSSGALVVAGNVSKNGTVFTSRAGSGTNIFTGVISGANANSDFVVDGGTTVFSNTMTYNGPTIVINGGTLELGTNDAIPTGSALRLGTNDTTGTVNLQGYNQTVASVEVQGTAGTNNLVTLGGGTLTIDSGGATTYAGAVSGSGTLQKSGAGTLTLSGSVTATNLRISGGAVALGADNVLGDSVNLDLNGGTFIVGSGGTRYSDTLGTLTLSANSTIDMGATGGLGTITFADSSGISWATNAVLTITNWQGVANLQSDVTKLLFGTGGLTSTQLGQIYFANQNVTGGGLVGGQGELAPIPEARVIWGAGALAAFIVWRERRRLAGLLKGTRESPPGS